MSDLQLALRVAVRAMDADTTTEAERNAILSSVVEYATSPGESEAAARALHHREQARKQQLILTELFNNSAA